MNYDSLPGSNSDNEDLQVKEQVLEFERLMNPAPAKTTFTFPAVFDGVGRSAQGTDSNSREK